MIEFGYVKLYSWLYFKYGLKEFYIDELYKNLRELGLKTPLNILLQRLSTKGYIERVSRGRYRVIHPYILFLESLGYRWRDRINKNYRLILEFIISSIIGYFRERLISIVLFGSLARGTTKNYSDIDLLVVAERIPSSYSKRVKILSSILEGVSEIRYRLWMEEKLYPLVDIILLTKEEARINHPFYLDMVDDAIIIYDRDSFMRHRIDKIRDKLTELGSQKVQLPDGRYYWVLKPSIKWGEVIEL